MPSAPWPSASWPRRASRGDVNGLFYGNPAQLGYQALSVVVAAAYSFAVTFVILKLVDLVIGLRVSTEEEEVGLDLTQHGERGYMLGLELTGGHPRAGRPSGTPRQPPLKSPPPSKLAPDLGAGSIALLARNSNL